MKQQSGFTLIELIMVIVILGILAATAMPKFSDLAGESRIAKVNAMKASMKSAAIMAHGMQLAQGVASSTSVTVNQGNGTVTMVNGYPDWAGMQVAVDMTDYVINTSGAAVDTNHPSCAASYVPSAAALGSTPQYIGISAVVDCG